MLELARSLRTQQGLLDEYVVRAFASVSAGDLCPMAAVVGAMAAQEALKVSSVGVLGPEVQLVVLEHIRRCLVTTRGHLLPALGRAAGLGCGGTALATEPAGPHSPQAITGKFLPLDQWLYFDALECLELEEAMQLTEEDCAPVRVCARKLPCTGDAVAAHAHIAPLSQ